MESVFALLIADRVGVFVFAISGGIVAVRRDMDLFGVIVMAFLPAIGGGTLRDLILDVPVFWLSDTATLFLAVGGGLTAFLTHRFLENFRPLRWADAMGMALFAVTGAAKAAELNHGVAVVLIMGTMTASAGGLIRDVVANQEPLLLKQDIYATAALLGSLVYFSVRAAGLDDGMAFIAGLASGFALRGLAIIFKLSLPKSPF
ncbi:MAG: trimeric intracellular cation channel family protein [Pseudomonadota bacterium]